MSRASDDITGCVFHYWTVLKREKNTTYGSSRWLCRCKCGTERIVQGGQLRKGISKSCGCWRKQSTSNRFTKHGMAKTTTYDCWEAMLARCNNPNANNYRNYGGRGIAVCDRWRDFKAFLEDMGEKPRGSTIDRIDNDGNYEPGNCRWVEHKANQRNKRTNHVFAFRGKTACLSELAEQCGLTYQTVASRILLGWSIELALTLPKHSRPFGRKNRLPGRAPK